MVLGCLTAKIKVSEHALRYFGRLASQVRQRTSYRAYAEDRGNMPGYFKAENNIDPLQNYTRNFSR